MLDPKMPSEVDKSDEVDEIIKSYKLYDILDSIWTLEYSYRSHSEDIEAINENIISFHVEHNNLIETRRSIVERAAILGRHEYHFIISREAYRSNFYNFRVYLFDLVFKYSIMNLDSLALWMIFQSNIGYDVAQGIIYIKGLGSPESRNILGIKKTTIIDRMKSLMWNQDITDIEDLLRSS
ncbi:hypothetical protein ACFOPQ_05325 [Deinococcus antarcticus]|uniref:Uncharacterized protein n=1 Tax=Deinococcus antarcticus TaxID=1298767 RepID=A0ABV8A7L1_9DEIO